jgi:heat shock protein HslJ
MVVGMKMMLAPSVVLLMAACGGAGGAGASPGAGVEFVLETLDGAPFAARATLVLGPGDAVSGQGPCNRWSARVAGQLPDFRPGPVVATRMACDDLAAEAAFLAALGAVTRAGTEGDRLILSDPGGERLVFRARGAADQP